MSDSPAQADQTLATDATTVQAQLDQLELRFGDLQRQLRQAQKLASLGTMSAMLAHEFKNLLTPVVSYAHYALEKGQPALMRAALEKTLQQSAKVTTLCERILGMAVDCNAGPAATPLRQIVDEARDRRGMTGRRIVLFIDEIHRFNKAQQDVILPYVEDGVVTL
ncbi:MAG: hypothetical protein ACE5K7_05260, partial [Phycisphaerae bacterium]